MDIVRPSIACRAAIWALFALFLSPHAARAADAGAVLGSISDTNGRPISGALIELDSLHERFAAKSDLGGTFVIAPVPAGVYQLGAQARGFQRVYGQVIEIVGNRQTCLELVLAHASAGGIATLGRVVVNGARALSTASAPTTDLDPQDLAGQGVEQLSTILSEQIALTMTHQIGGLPGLPQSASIRGPDPSETLVDIDGHQVNNSNTGDVDLELMDPAAFAGVQIVYGIGPSSLIGANTQGGAINFRTLEPTSENRALVRLNAASFGTFAETAHTTGTDGRLGYALSWHHYSTQGEIHDYPVALEPSGSLVNVGSGIDALSTLAKVRYSLYGGLGFADLTYRDTTASRDLSSAFVLPTDSNNTAPGAPFIDLNTAPGTHAPGAADLTNAPAFGLDLQVPVGRVDTAGSAPATLVARHLKSVTNDSTPFIDPSINPYLIDQRDFVADNSLEYDRYADNKTYTLMGDVRSEQLTAPAVLAPGPPTQSQTQRSFVGRAIWDSSPHLHYNAAAYFSNYDTFGTSIDPRVALVWTPTANAVVRASIGTGFRAPLLAERVFNPSLTAERTTEYEVSYQLRIGAGEAPAIAGVNAYRTNLRDPIFFTVASSGALLFLKNLGHVIYQGAELSYDTPLSAATSVRATFGVNIAYPVDNPFAFDPAAPNVVAGQQFQSIPPHKALLAIVHRMPGGTVASLIGAYESGNNELNRPAFVHFDATAARTFGRTQIALAARNLTNRFDDKFTLPGIGTPYPTSSGPSPTDAFSLQGRSLAITVTQRL